MTSGPASRLQLALPACFLHHPALNAVRSRFLRLHSRSAPRLRRVSLQQPHRHELCIRVPQSTQLHHGWTRWRARPRLRGCVCHCVGLTAGAGSDRGMAKLGGQRKARRLDERGMECAVQDACAARCGARGSGLVLILASSSSSPPEGQHGNTPLHIAARWDRLEVVEALIRMGARVNSRNKVREAVAPT